MEITNDPNEGATILRLSGYRVSGSRHIAQNVTLILTRSHGGTLDMRIETQFNDALVLDIDNEEVEQLRTALAPFESMYSEAERERGDEYWRDDNEG